MPQASNLPSHTALHNLNLLFKSFLLIASFSASPLFFGSFLVVYEGFLFLSSSLIWNLQEALILRPVYTSILVHFKINNFPCVCFLDNFQDHYPGENTLPEGIHLFFCFSIISFKLGDFNCMHVLYHFVVNLHFLAQMISRADVKYQMLTAIKFWLPCVSKTLMRTTFCCKTVPSFVTEEGSS